MRRLLLLRHAKSSWNRPDLDDAERPLNARGQRAAPLMGRYISGHGLLPDMVLCSTAVRARQTLELVTAEWETADGEEIKVVMRSSLYLASVAELLAIVRRTDDDVESIMLIGHNPGLATFAGLASGRGDSASLRAMAMKFPTAALAVIDFDADRWNTVAHGDGLLRSFTRPKDLR
ncbi:MAG: histidine phosphatase family protein [Pseudomonadota bacterium]